MHFYTPRETTPAFRYPASGGSGTPVATPRYALQLTATPGATVQKFNDLPFEEQGNVDEEVLLGTGTPPPANVTATTLGAGVQPRAPGSAPSMSEAQIADLICFLGALSDGYQAPATPPTSGTCVN